MRPEVSVSEHRLTCPFAGVQALHLARSLHDDTPDAGLSEGLAFPPLISLALDFHFWIYEAIGPLLKASRKTLRHLELFSLAHGMSEDVDALTSHLPIVLPTLHSLHIDDIWRGPLLDLVRLATSLTTLSIPNFDDLSRIAPLLPTATVTDIVLRGGWLEASSTLETLRCPSLANLKRVRFTMEARSSSRDQAGFRAVEALLLARGVTLEWDRQDNVVDGKEGAVPDCLPQGPSSFLRLVSCSSANSPSSRRWGLGRLPVAGGCRRRGTGPSRRRAQVV